MDSQTKKKLAAMSEGGKRLGEVRDMLEQSTEVGMPTIELEKLATKLLLATGGEPAFKKVPGYNWSTCININDGIVHGIPNDRKIEDGDLVSIDVGLWYEGFYTDTSTSLIVGKQDPELVSFLDWGREALREAIAEVKMGNRIGHISRAIQNSLKQHKLAAVPELTGHGVGVKLHERPYVPGFINTAVTQTPELTLGQTLAIEVIYTTGNGQIIIETDGWTISTKDGKISGLFEETVAVGETGPLLLTTNKV